MFAADKIAGGAVIRLFCEHNRHFQWVRWGTQTVVKTEPTGGGMDVVNLSEDVEELGEMKETGKAKETGEVKEEGDTKETEEVKEANVTEDIEEVKDVEDVEDVLDT